MPELAACFVTRQNIAVIDRAGDLLASIGSQDYARRLDLIYGASCGDHYRHIIQHYLAFFAGLSADEIDYDLRDRAAEMAHDRDAALSALGEIRRQLLVLNASDEPIRVRQNYDPTMPGEPVTSGIRRELQFLLSHTVHHFALIGIAAKALGVILPDGFALAPSTAYYLARLS